MLGEYLDEVRKKAPLVHNITNYVTVNDVANILLACGGSPIMSDEPADVEDITSICGGLNINIGTLNKRSIKGMKKAGRRAQELGHVILLDPVGAGASALRTKTAAELMDQIRFTVIRGNISEIKALALGSGTTKGVDADIADAVTDENLDDAIRFVKDFASKTGAVVAVTGAIDLVADAERCYVIRNGRPEMGSWPTPTTCWKQRRRRYARWAWRERLVTRISRSMREIPHTETASLMQSITWTAHASMRAQSSRYVNKLIRWIE